MLAHLSIAVQAVLALLALAGTAYYCSALLAARSYARGLSAKAARAASVNTPGVSILKPLRGYDAAMDDAFRSHCLQEYAGEYEILFGVASLDDSAVAAVRRVQQQFPERAIQLIECPERLGANGKVATLAQMLPHARFPVILINDSDIFAPPRYLASIAAELEDPRVGLVTALYRGHTVANNSGHHTVPSRFEALTLSTEFIGGVLMALRIEKKIKFALGATLAVRREVLDATGGFLPLVNLLADDYHLGLRAIQAGYSIALTRDVVATAVPPYSWRGFMQHQLRWLRTVRDARPGGYLGVCFTFGLLWAAMCVVASAGAAWSVALLSLALVARYALAFSLGIGILNDRQVLRDWWLIPFRDVAGALLWLWAYAGDTVEWRGLKFRLHKGSLTQVGS